ncbi:uncharacterized protein PAC_05646 [Phialocephala subalpina]|uniref:Uncharacterized protein n=1 Tax=Phialocephala subalpina TaxID=576137 RepID=A0A1L7WSL0_9HELO|nr:uncharacterized protein PAC_05646 [Phialocephala subalpina]
MGGNLSSKIVVNTSKDVISAPDAVNEKILAFLWLGSAYAIAMIWSTVLLCDRWGGPHGGRRVGLGSVLAAILLSTAWPIVFLYLMMSG